MDVSSLPAQVLALRVGPFAALDVVLVAVVVLFVADGIRRGFVGGALGLVGVLLALLGALQAYPLLSPHLVGWSVRPPIADAISFAVLLALAQATAALTVHWLLEILAPALRALGPFRPMERFAGALPGLLLAAVIATLVLAPARVLAVPDPLEAALARSAIAAELPQRTTPYVPGLERLMQQVVRASHPTYHINPDESVTIPHAADPQPDPDSEARMVELVNTERQRAGLHPLTVDEALRATARQHSAEMFRLAYFSHISPLQGNLQARLRGRVSYSTSSENIAFAPTVDAAHTGLMLSSSHRAAILTSHYTRIGIGVMNGGPVGRMSTQHFAG